MTSPVRKVRRLSRYRSRSRAGAGTPCGRPAAAGAGAAAPAIMRTRWLSDWLLSTSGSIPPASCGVHEPPPPVAATLGRLARVGVIVAGVGVAFAYTGGWLTPRALTPERFIDTFEQVNGPQRGFRRNHAKGVCASGFFESNGGGARLSRAVVFQ